jgi:hypothetical protein
MHAGAPDIKDLKDQLDAAERDAQALVADLGEERGGWRAETGSWSVAECLDHLATTNRVYLHAMEEPATRARAKEIKAEPRGARTRWALVRENHGTARQSAFQDEGSADC